MDIKQLPNNKDSEMYVLGSMCISKSALNIARDRLQIDDFYYPNHQTIFRAINEVIEAKLPVDIVVLTNHLEKNNLVADCGGLDYLAQIITYTTSAVNVESYIQIVEETALLRRLIQVSENISNMAFSSNDDVKEVLDQSEQMILSVVKQRNSSEFKNVSNVLMEVKNKLDFLQTVDGNITGLPTHFTLLDKMTNGLNASELIIIAARPAMGKTAFALNIAQNVAMHSKKSVAVFSLEMGAEQLMNRFLSSVGQIDASRLRTGKLAGREWEQLNSAMAKLSQTNLYFDDSAGITVGEIRAKCRRLAAKADLGVVIVDYLQLINSSTKYSSRQVEVSEISRLLKLMSLELQVPVIALSQLSRSVESREDKRPIMSDLRESGSIEQDADIVMFLYRDDYYNREATTSDVSEVEVIIAKHRNGPTGRLNLSFIKNYSKFTNQIRNDDEVM